MNSKLPEDLQKALDGISNVNPELKKLIEEGNVIALNKKYTEMMRNRSFDETDPDRPLSASSQVTLCQIVRRAMKLREVEEGIILSDDGRSATVFSTMG